MVARMRPHSVLNVADAGHVEGVEPDRSARVHQQRRYATGRIQSQRAATIDPWWRFRRE
jgi:hypothetical protein